MKKVDGELLEKYYSGMCNANERKIVEEWLASDAYDQPLDLPDHIKASQKAHIWRHVMEDVGQSKTKVIPLFKKIARYAAIACLFIAVGIVGNAILNNASSNNQMAYKNPDSRLTEQAQTYKISFTLSSKSKVSISNNSGKCGTTITFSGKMTLANKLSEGAQYTLKTTNGTERTVNLRQNTSYYVFTTTDGKSGKEVINTYDKKGILLHYDVNLVPKEILKEIFQHG